MSARLVVPKRSSSAPSTSGSSSINWWTISSLEIVAAPWRANARSASLFPAPIPPVIATLSGFFGLVRLGFGFRSGLSFGFRDGLGFSFDLRDGLDFGPCDRLGFGF
jgi:hypothetical protein